MKNIKHTIVTLLFLLLLILFSSCSRVSEERLWGDWNMTYYQLRNNSTGDTRTYTFNDMTGYTVYSFGEDGRLTITSPGGLNNRLIYSYSLNGNEITMTYTGSLSNGYEIVEGDVAMQGEISRLTSSELVLDLTMAGVFREEDRTLDDTGTLHMEFERAR